MEPIKLCIKIESKDFLDFQLTYLRKTIGVKFIIFASILILIILLPSLFIGFNLDLDYFKAFIIPLSIFVFLPVLVLITTYFTAKKSFVNDFQIQKEQEYKFNLEGLCFSTSNSTISLKWEEILKYDESKKAFYVYISLQKAYKIPKRLLNENLIINVRTWLSQNAKPNKKIKISILPMPLRIVIYLILGIVIAGVNFPNVRESIYVISRLNNFDYSPSNAYEEIKKYTKEIENDITNAYYNRAISKMSIKNHKAAIYDFTLAIYFDKNFAKAYYNRGKSKYFSQDYVGACEDFFAASDLGYSHADKSIEQNCN